MLLVLFVDSYITSYISFLLGGNRNLVDASNIAALAALLTFRRPECTLGGEDGQEVIIHPPEVRNCNFLVNETNACKKC